LHYTGSTAGATHPLKRISRLCLPSTLASRDDEAAFLDLNLVGGRLLYVVIAWGREAERLRRQGVEAWITIEMLSGWKARAKYKEGHDASNQLVLPYVSAGPGR